MYVKWSQDQCTRYNVSKRERKKKKKIQKSSLHQDTKTLPLKKSPILTLPLKV